MKTKIAFTIVVASAGIVAGVICLSDRSPTQPVTLQPKLVAASPLTASKPPVPIKVAVSNTPPTDSRTPPARVAKSNVIAKSPVEEVPATGRPLVINGYTMQDPVAREALGYVGTDPDADAYWIAAISDPGLPAEERKDLIEDLNEDGLANPHLATTEDLPVIASRIELIEELAPQSIDQADADAFAEAYKDLANLFNGLPAD